MHIALIYPPPWAIPKPGGSELPAGFGPPSGWAPDQRFGGDEITMPYGLMSLAAQAIRAGHRVIVLNLYAFAWQDIAEIISATPAELFGLSCLTGNRRGTEALAELIREHHPSARIIVGGPHATALPMEILKQWPAVDAVVVGEGEETFCDVIGAMEGGGVVAGLAGMAWRENGTVTGGPSRSRICDLDSLASPYDYWSLGAVMASRGCPHACTFCGSPVLWGREVRFHSADHMVSVLDRIVNRHGVKTVAVKDDTFTANRRLTLEICRRIPAAGLRFAWSCDTRADSVDEELLVAMRRAGCERISLGVESAAPDILDNIRKRIPIRRVLAATRIAQKYGFQIRYYMMAGNRGETAETLDDSIAFLHLARPNQFVFSFLSLYPGTAEFELAEKDGLATRRMFFDSDRQTFKCFRKKRGGPELLSHVEWILAHPREERFWRYGVKERQAILKLLPDLPGAYLDLGVAWLEAGNLDRAEACIWKSLRMDYPLPALAYNALACIAALRNNLESALSYLDRAGLKEPHRIVRRNRDTLRQWIEDKQWRKRPVPALAVHSGFERTGPLRQPVDPGPIRSAELPGGVRFRERVYLPRFIQ